MSGRGDHFTCGRVVLIWEQRQFSPCNRWKTGGKKESLWDHLEVPYNCLYFLGKMKNKDTKRVRVKDKVL